MIHCFTCGADLPDNMIYCLHCGNPLNDETPTVIRTADPAASDTRKTPAMFYVLGASGVIAVMLFAFFISGNKPIPATVPPSANANTVNVASTPAATPPTAAKAAAPEPTKAQPASKPKTKSTPIDVESQRAQIDELYRRDREAAIANAMMRAATANAMRKPANR